MESVLQRYARLIIEDQLRLESGESLSINTESSMMYFARLLAKMACEATLQVVNIVETNHGKVAQVLPMEPVEKEIFRPQMKGFVMCHLVDLDSRTYVSDEDPMLAKDEVTKLASYGLLSDPVFLDRRIAVPWANIPIPGLEWASQLLGHQCGEAEMWELFSSIYRLGDDYNLHFWAAQGNLLHYRKKKFNDLGLCSYALTGDGWELNAKQATNTQWAGGRVTLAGNRSFFPTLPMQSIHCSFNQESAQGTFASSRPFLLMGKEVCDATFTVEKGKVVAYDASKGIEALSAFFAIDEGALKVSEISVCDHDTIESRYMTRSIHSHFAKEITTCVILGGFSLDTLTNQITEEDVADSALVQSLVRLEIPVGTHALSVTAKTQDGDFFPIVEEGIIID